MSATPCGNCRKPRPLRRDQPRSEDGRLGLCWGCYHRWDRAGRPVVSGVRVIPEPGSAPRVSRSRLGRIEDYLELTREWHETPERAAARLNVTTRTIRRYEAALAGAA